MFCLAIRTPVVSIYDFAKFGGQLILDAVWTRPMMINGGIMERQYPP